ncbi:MAG: tetratricopeptide repeat protein [Phycisphaerales bacterium]
MNREEFQRIDDLFRHAVQLPVADRAAFLDAACGTDSALRRNVQSLLDEDGAVAGALDGGALGPNAEGQRSPVVQAADVMTGADEPGLPDGGQIGPYRLLESLGEGGFGVVFLAEQTEPVHRRVALKVIKLGMDTRQVIARFEAERQALALMDHPHIATVLDAGATGQGRPYFVMELCGGQPITAYCREQDLPLDARLELIGQVCRAVEHAHQKGVIHRDIKPGNVLVETRDGRPFARVIDFGIAKATDARLTEQTYFTEHRQMIGTPEYMSPEQADGLPDVDTRTDVYALGVLLYELLTGTTPHDAGALRSAAWGEIQRIIREVEPPPPSTRRTEVAGPRGTRSNGGPTPDRSGGVPTPRGELDWIVMKALAKERDRRYQSAGELAADILRHRTGEPVSAAPPSRIYRARTFVRRNRGLVVGMAAIVAVLGAGVVGTTWGLLRAIDAGNREAAAATTAIEEGNRADAAAREAEARAADLELVVGFQTAQIAGLDAAAVGTRIRASVVSELPEHLGDQALPALDAVNFTNVALRTLREDLLERALDAANSEFADRPLVRARLLQSISDSARDLGMLDLAEGPQLEALAIHEREQGPEARDTIDALYRRVLLLLDQSRYSEAEPLARRAADLHRRVIGDSTETLNAVSVHGVVLRGLERLDEALPLYREAYEGHLRLEGPDDPGTLLLLNNLGFILRAVGRMDEAEQVFRDTLDGRKRVLGPDHSGTLSSMMNLAGALRSAGRLDEAEPLYLEALAGHRRLHGDDHTRTLTSVGNVGVFYLSGRRYEEADRFLGEAVEGLTRIIGPEAIQTVIYRIHRGHALARWGRVDEARTVLEATSEIAARVFGADSPSVIRSELGLAIATREAGDVDGAVRALEALNTRAIGIGGAEWPFAKEVARALAETRP